MMEIIGYGILLAIGWFIAPFLIMGTLALIGGIISIITGDRR